MKTPTAFWAAVLCAAGLAVTGSPALAQADFFEDFEDISQPLPGQDGPPELIARGWTFRNQSEPKGITIWRRGDLVDYPGPTIQAHTGQAYLTSYASWDDGNRGISTWAILPPIPNQGAGDQVSLYLAGFFTTEDRIQVRYSPGGGTDTGSGLNDVGDFTQLLVETANSVGDYTWHQVTATVPGTGRLAVRWYDAGVPAPYSPAIAIDTLSVGAPPCNWPPLPGPGDEVTWTADSSPYDICDDATIPAGATVNVEPGVTVNFQSGTTLTLQGTIHALGTADQPIVLTHVAVFPPMVDVNGGTLDAAFVEFGGQLRVTSAATVLADDCVFSGNGLIWAQELPSIPPFIHLTRCTFDSSSMSLSDAIAVLEHNTFLDSGASLLRGYSELRGTNTFNGRPLAITRERLQNAQPLYVDGVTVTGVTDGAGLVLEGGNYLPGPGNVIQGNLYPIRVLGGLLPESVVPTTGNTNNVIDVGNGGFNGVGRWSNLGLPYRLTESAGTLPGGDLLVDPGVLVECSAGSGIVVRSTRRVMLEGLPDAPIAFASLNPNQPWQGLLFGTNSDEGPRLEYCTIQDAAFGVISSDNSMDVDNCLFEHNQTGANCNTYGIARFAKTRFLSNDVGVSMTETGTPVLASQTTPNSIEGNGAGIDAFEYGSAADARFVWWGDPSGPQHPDNPDGQGDSVVGPGAGNVDVIPFLTARPDYTDTPPVVRVQEPGFAPHWRGWGLGYRGTSGIIGYLLEPGQKFIVRWNAEDDDAVVSQRVELGSLLLADNLPAGQRSFEFTVPQLDPGGAASHVQAFLRVTAIDSTGQEGWDHTPVMVVAHPGQTDIQISSSFSGQTFTAGTPIPDVFYSGTLGGLDELSAYLLFESEGVFMTAAYHDTNGQRFEFFEPFPMLSTDRARLVLELKHYVNAYETATAYIFDSGYFSVRLDPRLELSPPNVNVTQPTGGTRFLGGGIVPIEWSASDAESLYGFDVLASFDGGQRWHLIARNLPAGVRNYDWRLPPSEDIPDVRIRVVARNLRFQNSASESEAFGIRRRPTPRPAPGAATP